LKVYFDGQIFIDQVTGGISRYYANLASELNDSESVTARVIAPLYRNEHLADQQRASIMGLKLPAHWRAGRVCWATLRVASPIISALGRPDIAHETYFPVKPYLTTARRRVTTVYDMIHELYFPGSMTSERKKNALTRCDHVLCISKNTQKDLCELFDFPIERTSVTYLSYMDFSACKGSLHPSVLQDKKPYFLHVGQRSFYKNFPLLVRAFASSAYLRNNFRIVCFGGAEMTDAERSYALDLGLSDEHITHMKGGDDLLGSVYAHATAFVYPSLYEGFGIPPLEAMSVGCPVLSSNRSSLPEVVGNAGILFDPEDHESLRVAMEQVADSESLRNDFASKGYLQCRQFTWKQCAADTLQAYQRLL
jgi:glycosyltransferase involved in cell wall biosynthesis